MDDAAMVIPLTTEKKVVLIKQFKPGANEIMLQFPAGRIEEKHASIMDAARSELAEETGIRVSEDQLHLFAKLSVASTKNSELVYFFLAEKCEFNAAQDLDKNEEIEILTLSFDEIDQMILNGQIWCVQSIAAWQLTKVKFPHLFRHTK